MARIIDTLSLPCAPEPYKLFTVSGYGEFGPMEGVLQENFTGMDFLAFYDNDPNPNSIYDKRFIIWKAGIDFPDTEIAQFNPVVELKPDWATTDRYWLCQLSWADPAWIAANTYVEPEPEPDPE